jgi:hypothetical protein
MTCHNLSYSPELANNHDAGLDREWWRLSGEPWSANNLARCGSRRRQASDLRQVISFVLRGGRLMAGCSRAASFALMQSNSDGVSALPYEGNWSAAIGGAVNIVTFRCYVMFGLLFAGLLLWARQRLRLHQQGAHLGRFSLDFRFSSKDRLSLTTASGAKRTFAKIPT